MTRRWRVLSAVVAVAALAAGTAVVAASPALADQVVETSQMVPVGAEPDGTAVKLDVSIFTPRAPGRHPAIVLAHGFGGTKADSAASAKTFAADGYVVLTYTARGFGASGGRIHLDAPTYEVADASKLVDLLATRPDVELDGPGNPRVGIAGASYGGALALLAAGYDKRIDAVAAAITWNDLGQALFPESATAGAQPDTLAGSLPAAQPGVFKQRWASLLFGDAAGVTSGSSDGAGSASLLGCGRFDPAVCAAYRRAAVTGKADASLQKLLAASSPASIAGRITAPTLLLQGQQDALFGLDQSDATAREITAAGPTPVRVAWFAGGHDATSGAGANSTLADDGAAWFDRYLAGDPGDDDPGFAFTTTSTDRGVGSTAVTTRRLDGYPGVAGASAATRTPIRLHGDTQDVVSPPGGSPAALTGMPGAGTALSALGATGAGTALAILPGQSATFSSDQLDADTVLAGSSRVGLSVTSTASDAVLFASLWIVSGSGSSARAVLPEQLVAPLRVSGLRPGHAATVEVALPAIAVDVPAGAHLQVVVSSTDQAYAVPTKARLYTVGLAGTGETDIPVVTGSTVVGGSNGVPWALLGFVAAVVLASVITAIILGRRGRSLGAAAVGSADGDDGEVVLSVNGLVKTYGHGVRAVDGGFWTARRGQVVGLLGPNGAGKTTTMRMIVGLVQPDAGHTEVLGQVIAAGSPVLADVGGYIEGPGFLPHLSGRRNLEASWAATGRDPAEAHLDEVLAIAGLGTALDRPVRTYSHGMKARLGIAAAMAGLPAVLILDEPTNGLDPPQIAAMRSVLHDYAAIGRTVIISSHLLAEVEATCTHVVVMARGALVAAGSVADLLDAGTTVEIRVDRPEAALAAVRGWDGAGVAELGGDGALVLDRGIHTVAEVVARLVGEGIGVEQVTHRRALEDVFLDLVTP